MGKTIIKDERRKTLLFILVFFLFSVICSVIGILYLAELKQPFIMRNFYTFATIYGVAVVAVFLTSVIFPINQKETFTKFFISFYVLFLFIVLLLYVLEKTGFFEVFKDTESLQEYLGGAGAWMPFLYTLLQFLQVVILPIPSMVSTLAGVALFGSFWATVYSTIGILLGSYLAFFLGRKLGNKAVTWMIGEETLLKWKKRLKGKDNFFLTLMFFLPLFPDDILCLFAGLSTMSVGYFIWVITISRIISIAATCYSIDLIPFNTWWGITLWILFFVLMIFVFIFTSKNMDKIQRKIKAFRKKLSKKNTKA